MTPEELKQQFEALMAELKSYREKAEEQQKTQGTMSEELAKKIDAVQKQVDAIDVKLAENQKPGNSPTIPDLRKRLEEDGALQNLMRTKNGNAHIELSPEETKLLWEGKATVTESAVGVATTGVLPIERIPGIVPEARQELTIRDALTARPTSRLVVDYVKVNTPMMTASPQTEASAKAENLISFEALSKQVQTIATWIPASRQVLDDMDELMAVLRGALVYAVDHQEEIQLLSGDGTGTNLSGLLTEATAFNTGLLIAADGWTRIDIVARAIQQIQVAKELVPTFIVLHPTDWWNIRLTKDSYGRYILGSPQTVLGTPQMGGTLGAPPRIFGLLPIVTTNITAGTFLVGSGSEMASEIRDRMGVQVEIATQHSDYFTKNLIAVRAEKRLCLVTKRPGSYITGSFSTSP